MTQETDKSILVQRILSRQCTHCGTPLRADNGCDTCNRSPLNDRISSLRETLNDKMESVKNIVNSNSEKLEEISIIVEEIKRLNHYTKKD